MNAPADAVWGVVRAFDSPNDWHPALPECHIEGDLPADTVGCVRVFAPHGEEKRREILLALDDDERRCTYTADKSLMPLRNYRATLRVRPVTSGDRSFVEWSADFDCAPEDEERLVATLSGIVFAAGLEALEKRFAD